MAPVVKSPRGARRHVQAPELAEATRKVGPDSELSGRPHWFWRPRFVLVVVLIVLGGCSLLLHPGGYLGTDTGPKVATIDAMSTAGNARPTVGYWASSIDPDGSLHPMGWNLTPVATEPGAEPAFVVVTTLPMLYLAQPLYALGGIRLALLVPILGTVATTAAAGALSRRFGSPTGAPAMWVVGLGSPATVYALDLWEHAPGLGLMAWGFVAAVDAVGNDRRWFHPLMVGLAFGAAATMRQEAMIYCVAVGVALAAALLPWPTSLRTRLVDPGRDGPGDGGRPALDSSGTEARSVAQAVTALGLVGVAALAVLAAGALAEATIIGETTRVDRGLGTLSAGGDSIADRIVAGLVTLGSPSTGSLALVVISAFWFVGSLAGTGMALTRNWAPHRIMVAAGAAYLAVGLNWVVNGGSFLSGLVVAAPLAGIGIGLGSTSTPERLVRGASLVALPLVMGFQYVDGAGPQWGGRYLLASGFGLTVLAMTRIERSHHAFVPIALAVSLLTAGAGVSWTVERSRSFGQAGEALSAYADTAVNEPLVFLDPFVPQEFGTAALDNRWMAASGSAERAEAVAVLRELDVQRFAVVEVNRGRGPADFPGARPVDDGVLLSLIATEQLRVTSYLIEQ